MVLMLATGAQTMQPNPGKSWALALCGVLQVL
jgi:hypothetical protein